MTDVERLLCSACGNNIDAYFENNRIMGPWGRAKASESTILTPKAFSTERVDPFFAFLSFFYLFYCAF